MDFIKQLNGFRRKRLINPIGANCISLYLTLFEYSNELWFPERFTVANSTLQEQSGLKSLSSMQRARNKLMQDGYIVYKSSSGSRCGTYELVDLCKEDDGQKEFDTSICPTNDQQMVSKRPANDQQVTNKRPANDQQVTNKRPTNDQQVTTLNKPNINKNININNLYNNHDNYALAQVIDFYQKNMGVDVSPHIAEAIDNWLGDVDISLIYYAISEAVTANVRNWKYINSIIQSHFAAGRKTWAEAETAGQRRRGQSTTAEPWEDDVDDILLGGAKSGAD